MLKFVSLKVSPLKRELFYHKIQYSKVFKFDMSAAILGIVVSTIFSMLAVASVGTCSVDLSDLCIIFYYFFLVFLVLKNLNFITIDMLKNLYFIILIVLKK